MLSERLVGRTRILLKKEDSSPIGCCPLRGRDAKIVTELLDKAGISCMYLPPYSPDLNPIEKMRSKMKSILRAL